MRYPPLLGTFRRITHPFATRQQTEAPVTVRLACVKHAASVQSEPGSNSSVQSLFKLKFRSQNSILTYFICASAWCPSAYTYRLYSVKDQFKQLKLESCLLLLCCSEEANYTYLSHTRQQLQTEKSIKKDNSLFRLISFFSGSIGIRTCSLFFD